MKTFKISTLLLMLTLSFSVFASDIPDVIVGNDTVSMVIPEKNYGRYDRGLKNYLFIPKGDWQFGLNASFGEFDTEDMQLLSIMKDFDFKAKVYSVKPMVSYFFNNNQSVGVRLNYTQADADLGSMVVDFDEDINFDIKNVSFDCHMYSASIFYRRYIGLGLDKRFAIYNEAALNIGGGSSTFKRYYNNILRDTRSDVFEASLNFSPGVCMFITDNVNFNVAFDVLGLYLRDESQKTNGVEEGSRFSSGANFRFNLFSINFGIGVTI